MGSQKVVTPAKSGFQASHNYMKILDSGFRRNDGKGNFSIFYEFVNINELTKSQEAQKESTICSELGLVLFSVKRSRV